MARRVSSSNCNAGVPTEQFPTHQLKQDKMSYSYYLLCTNCTTLMYIIVINVMYSYIMLNTIKPTYLMTDYCLHGTAPISLYVDEQFSCNNFYDSYINTNSFAFKTEESVG
jgi:hypothetical protein